MESAAYGCATITSQKGGLLETFDNDLFLNKLSVNEILKKISFLIKNPKKLKFYQRKNFDNPIHLIKNLVAFLDSVKINMYKKIYISINLLVQKYYISQILTKKIINDYLIFQSHQN